MSIAKFCIQLKTIKLNFYQICQTKIKNITFSQIMNTNHVNENMNHNITLS